MKNVGQFLTEVKNELFKVIWPKPEDLMGSIVIVLMVVIAFAIYLGAVDFIFYKMAQQIF